MRSESEAARDRTLMTRGLSHTTRRNQNGIDTRSKIGDEALCFLNTVSEKVVADGGYELKRGRSICHGKVSSKKVTPLLVTNISLTAALLFTEMRSTVAKRSFTSLSRCLLRRRLPRIATRALLPAPFPVPQQHRFPEVLGCRCRPRAPLSCRPACRRT